MDIKKPWAVLVLIIGIFWAWLHIYFIIIYFIIIYSEQKKQLIIKKIVYGSVKPHYI